MLASQAAIPPSLTCNIGTGSPTSLDQLLRAIALSVGTDVDQTVGPPRPGDIPHSYADIGVARRALGYEPRTSLAEGIARTIDWYRLASIGPTVTAERPDPLTDPANRAVPSVCPALDHRAREACRSRGPRLRLADDRPRTKRSRSGSRRRSGSHAVALNSATAALHLALEALGVGPGTRSSSRPGRSRPRRGRRLPRRPTGARRRRSADAQHHAEIVLAAVTPRTRAVDGRPHRRHARSRSSDWSRCSSHVASPSSRMPRMRSRAASVGRRPLCRHVRARRRLLVLRDEDDHDRRGRDARHRRRRDR